MREGWIAGGIVVGIGLVCAVGFALGHDLTPIRVTFATLAAAAGVLLVLWAARSRRLVHGLHEVSEPAELCGIAVRLGEVGESAFVAGLRRPTIYCDRRLVQRLTPAQLRAVLLHERAHQRSRDPARLLLFGVVAPVLRHVPCGRQWLAAARARREIAADHEALAQGVQRADLAAALLRLRPVVPTHAAGFTPALELRLRALLGDAADVAATRTACHLGGGLAGVAVGAALCAWVLHHHVVHWVDAACC